MTPNALAAIHAVRTKRLQQAVHELEAALADGQAIGQALLQVSGLLERGIDPRSIRTAHRDLQRLLETARAIEARQLADTTQGARCPSRRMPV